MEEILNKFRETGHVSYAIALINALRAENLQESINLGRTFVDSFPTNEGVITALCESLITAGDVISAYLFYDKVLQFRNLSESRSKEILHKQMSIINDKIENGFTSYNKERMDAIVNRKERSYKMVTFTITTCKRFELFQQTMNSFINCCNDIGLIDEWLCVDDNSTSVDREKMKELYPFFTFVWKEYSDKGHANSMNIIRDKVNTPYIFHMEDDWKFIAQRNYISDCLDVLGQNYTIGQCLINKNSAETPKDIQTLGGEFNTTPFGIRYYVHEYIVTDEDKQRFINKHGNGQNCAYWPHYSLRPSLTRTRVITDIGEYNTNAAHFEMEYANRYVDKGFKTAFLEGIYSVHIGRLTSERFDETKLNAYKLNNQNQFSEPVQNETKVVVEEIKPVQKSVKLAAVVINLDKRADRYEAFMKRKPDELKCIRMPAIDGANIKPNINLCKLFEHNDFNMREGIVGCALSHIKLYTDMLTADEMDYLLILEDDAEFAPNFWIILNNLLGSISSTNIDLLYLGHHIRKEHTTTDFDYFDGKQTQMSVEKWNTQTSLTKSLGGTFGYLITKNGAQKLLNYINEKSVTNGIDTIQQKTADIMDVYYCTPHLVRSSVYDYDKTSDTDIQKNFNSLSMNLFEKMKEENRRYDTMEILEDNQVIDRINNGEVFTILSELSSDSVNLIQKLLKPNMVMYLLHDNVYIISNDPKKRYPERLHVENGKYVLDFIVPK